MSGREDASPPRVRRVHLRVPVAVYDGKRTLPAEIRNLSESGAFISTTPPFPLETGVSFWLTMEGAKVLIRAHVRWTRSLEGVEGEPVGCGLEFYDPDRTLATELQPLIERSAGRL